jgi:hypothetical protein
VIVFAGMAISAVLVLTFTTSSEVAGRFTAAATTILAVATVALGFQTRNAVRVNQQEMDQNASLLELTRRQADSAELTAQIMSETNRPLVAPNVDGLIWVGKVGGKWKVSFPVQNLGSNIALIETDFRRPKLLFADNGDHLAFGQPDSVVLPNGLTTNINFSIDPNVVARAGGPITRSDGTYIAAAFDYWFTDIARRAHYMVHVEFDSEESHDDKIETLLRLTNVEFSSPLIST